jgi:hypothetical protein
MEKNLEELGSSKLQVLHLGLQSTTDVGTVIV